MIVLTSAFVFAALIASRSVQPPALDVQNPSSVSAVELTTSVVGIGSSLVMVSEVGLGAPMVAPFRLPVSLSVRLTVSLAS